jgi:CheY-like chemotaxis protein
MIAATPMPAADRQYRVLIVDDDKPILHFADRTLRSAGYETALAPNGHAALELVSTAPAFDLLVTDLMMPNMRGDDLARRMRVAFPDLRVLYLTGFTDALFTSRPLLWENETFVEKPITTEGLREAVSMALFGHTRGLSPT